MITETELTQTKVRKLNIFRNDCEVCKKTAIIDNEKLFKSNGVEKKLITLRCGHIRIVEADSHSPFESVVSNFYKPHVMNCNHKWTINQCDLCGEYKLFPFQIEGARFLEQQNGRAAIFDQQGLGKTVQALAFLKFHQECLPALFIVKSKLKFQWLTEIIRWCGESYFPQIIGDGKTGVAKGLKCYITSFDLLRNIDKKKLESLNLQSVIIDEVQAVKNPSSARTIHLQAICKNIPHIIPLSGTPWKNRGSEFFVVLNMLSPQKFWSMQYFLDHWVDYYMHGNQPKQGGIRNIAKFKEYTKDLLIRRERDDVMPELPKTNRVRLTCQIEDSARKAYEEEVSEFVKWYNELIISGEEDSASSEQGMLARLNRMRHIIALAKIPYTIDWTEEFLDETDRHLIIGVHHKDVGLILVNQLKKLNKCEVFTMTSTQNDDERQRVKMAYINSKRAIMVASTLSAGEGTDGLQKVCYDMVIHERQWNPMNEEQLEDRLARIGSIAPQKVNVTYIHADDSTDIQLDAIVESKRIQFHAAMNKGAMPAWHEGSIISELGKMIIQRGVRK